MQKRETEWKIKRKNKMNNQKFFEQYGHEKWAVEQNLCFLLQEYAEKLGIKNPYNPVTFVKQFMKEETLVEAELAEKSAIDRLSKQADIIDADFKEIEEVTEKEQTDNSSQLSLFGITEGIICQQVNCCGVMGAGLAKAILEEYPQVKDWYDAYYRHTKNNKNANAICHFNQLGKIDLIPLDFKLDKYLTEKAYLDASATKAYIVSHNSNLAVANIYSQDFYGNPEKTKKVYTKLSILIDCIGKIAKKFPDRKVYIPHTKNLEGKRDYGIGCGYGGEVWESVYPQLQELAEKQDNLYLLDTKTGEVEKVNSIQELEKDDEMER